MLAAIRAHPPDYVIVSTRDSSEMGAALFGVDYATSLWDWLVAHYIEVERFGAWPAEASGFGLAVFERYTVDDSPVLTPEEDS